MNEMVEASQQIQYGMWNSTIAPFMFQAQNTLPPIIDGHAHDENLAIHTPMEESPHLSFTTSTIISKNTEECPEFDTRPASPYNLAKEQGKRAKKACAKCRNRKKGCKQDREILCSRWPRTASEFADTQVRAVITSEPPNSEMDRKVQRLQAEIASLKQQNMRLRRKDRISRQHLQRISDLTSIVGVSYVIR